MAKFDIPIKRLVERMPADWVRFVCPEAAPESIRPLAKELTPKAQSRLDEVFTVMTPAGEVILHLEAQGYRDPAFPARMLRYRADIWEHTMTAGLGAPAVRQVAVFFFPKDENKVHGFTDDGIDYNYHVVRLWEVKQADVIGQGMVGFYPALPLMKGAAGVTPEDVMRQAMDHIAADVEDDALQRDMIAVLSIFGQEVYGSDIVRKFVRREMLMQSEVFREWFADDIRKAKAEVLREVILDNLTDRFAVIRQPLRDKIAAVSDAGVLKALQKWSVQVASLEEFEGHLNKITTA